MYICNYYKPFENIPKYEGYMPTDPLQKFDPSCAFEFAPKRNIMYAENVIYLNMRFVCVCLYNKWR